MLEPGSITNPNPNPNILEPVSNSNSNSNSNSRMGRTCDDEGLLEVQLAAVDERGEVLERVLLDVALLSGVATSASRLKMLRKSGWIMSGWGGCSARGLQGTREVLSFGARLRCAATTDSGPVWRC
eukprot:1730693-Rhodomonas_salina.1